MTANVSQHNQSRDAGKTLEVLFEISAAVNSTRTLEELYAEIHQALGKIFNVDNFYIALHHEEKDSISFPYFVDEMDDTVTEIFNFSETGSLTGQVIKAKEPCIFNEDQIRELGLRTKRSATIGTVSKIWLGAPLIIKDKVIGVITIQSYRSANDFTGSDLNLLNSVSQHIALAIERKESDEKLTEQRQLLHKILETSPVGIAYLENRVFKWVNTEMVHMLGYDLKSELENQSVRMIYSSDKEYDTAGQIISKDLALKGKCDLEFNLIKKDGATFSASLMLSSFNPVNTMAATIAIITDISEQKTAQQEKIEKEKLQGVLEMAGAICHELNQPLQTIIGYSSLFKSPQDLREEDLDSIREQASRIGEITRRLANITQYKTKEYPGKTKIVDIWGSSRKPN